MFDVKVSESGEMGSVDVVGPGIRDTGVTINLFGASVVSRWANAEDFYRAVAVRNVMSALASALAASGGDPEQAVIYYNVCMAEEYGDRAEHGVTFDRERLLNG